MPLKKTMKKKPRIIKKVVSFPPISKDNKLCCAIRFYDNEPEIIQQFIISKPLVEVIQVSGESNYDVMQGDTTANTYISRFLSLYPKNAYALFLKQGNIQENKTAIGFSRDNGENLKQWVIKTKSEKAVLFDWDRTLSVLEGIMVPPNKWVINEFKKKKISYYDMALYYAGTKARLQYLRGLSDFLEKHRVHIYILTNNPLATNYWEKWINTAAVGPESRHQFFMVVKQFFPSLKIENVLCGLDTDGFKPDVFLTNQHLRDMYGRMEHWHYIHSHTGLLYR